MQLHVVVHQPAKTAISPCSSPLGMFCEEGRLMWQRQKFHTDDVNQCSLVVMGFQICSFLLIDGQKINNSKNKKLETFSLYSLASKTCLKCSPMPLTSHIFICVVFYFIAIKNILSFVYASTAHGNERKPPLKALWPTAIWLVY